jgi:hypothetical protein
MDDARLPMALFLDLLSVGICCIGLFWSAEISKSEHALDVVIGPLENASSYGAPLATEHSPNPKVLVPGFLP